MIRVILILAGLLVWPVAAQAQSGVLIEMIEREGARVTLTLQGSQARIESLGEPWMLIDWSRNTFHVVDEQERQIIDLSQMVGRPAPALSPEAVGARLVARGAGPQVAGYPTERHAVMVGATHCEDVYASPRLMQEAGLQPLGEALLQMERVFGADEALLGVPDDPCTQANRALGSALYALGFPMRVVAADGLVENEVVRVERGAELPGDHFDLPQGYQVVRMDQLLEQQRQMQQELMRRLPEEGIDDETRRQLEAFMREMEQQRQR